MSTRETSTDISSLAARILNEEPREGDEHLSYNALLVQAKKLAGSCLSQTEDDEKDGAPRIALTAKVDWEKIVNAIIGALEGGSTYWLQRYEYTHTPDAIMDNPAYSCVDFWAKGGRMVLTYDNPEGEDTKDKEIGLNEIRLGLRSMAAESPRHFGDLLSENDDAITHDVFIQHVIFSEVVYG